MLRVMLIAGGALVVLGAAAEAQTIGTAAEVMGAEAGHSDNGAKDFARKAGQSDEFERREARLALERAQSPAVRAFAAKMLEANTETTQSLNQAMRAAGMAPQKPTVMTADEEEMLRHLASFHGAAFDREYIKQQFAAHRDALAVAQAYARNGATGPVVDAAKSLVGVIQSHLALLSTVQSELG